jgi:hypothetical protein
MSQTYLPSGKKARSLEKDRVVNDYRFNQLLLLKDKEDRLSYKISTIPENSLEKKLREKRVRLLQELDVIRDKIKVLEKFKNI